MWSYWIARRNSPRRRPRPRSHRADQRIAAAALIVVAAGFLLARFVEPPPETPPPPRTVRTNFELPEDLELVVARGIDQRVGRYPPIAIDRDGRRIAVVAKAADDITRIYVRDLDAPELTPLTGSEKAELPLLFARRPFGWLSHRIARLQIARRRRGGHGDRERPAR